MLANHRRRIIIRYLQDHTVTTLDTLAETIAQIERENPTTSQIKTVKTALYETHAPRLDDIHAVSYDSRQKTVARGDSYDKLYALLAAVDDELS